MDAIFLSSGLKALRAGINVIARARKQFAKRLVDIKDELIAIDGSLAKGWVPHKESNALAQTINFAESARKGVIEGLEKLFDEKLPRIGYLLREADVFLDGKRRKGAEHVYMRKAREEDFHLPKGSRAVKEAQKEIQGAIGIIDSTIKEFTEQRSPIDLQ